MLHQTYRSRLAALLLAACVFASQVAGVRAQSVTNATSDYVHVLRQVVALLNQPPGTHNLFVSSPAEAAQHLRLRRARWDRGHQHAVEMFAQAGRLMDPHFSEMTAGQLPDDALAFIKAFLLVKLPPTDHSDDVKKALVGAETALNIMTAANVPTEPAPAATARGHVKPTPAASVRNAAAACARLRDDLAALHRILETTKRDPHAHAASTDAVSLEATFLASIETLIAQTSAQRRTHCP